MFIGIGLGTSAQGSGRGDRTAPTITSSASVSVAENATLAHSLTANESVVWTITGGADAARLEISGSTLRWASNGTKDFEAPDDANTDNAYVVQVTATDAALNATNQTITVTVTDVVEGPSDLWPLVAMGADTDWVFPDEDSVSWNASPPSGPSFSGAPAGQSAELTGAAKTAFDAAVASLTAYSVTIYDTYDTGHDGPLEVSMKGGTPVTFTFTNGGPNSITHAVTSGSGSGFILDSGGGDGLALNVTDVEINP